jgi:hypothetical protein
MRTRNPLNDSHPPARRVWGIDAIGLTQPSFRRGSLRHDRDKTGHLTDQDFENVRQWTQSQLTSWMSFSIAVQFRFAPAGETSG